MSPDEPTPQMPFEPDFHGIPGPPQSSLRCTLTVTQEFVDGDIRTEITGKIEPGGTLSQVAALMVLNDAASLIIRKLAQAETKRQVEGNNGTPKKQAKSTLWVPDGFGGN